MVGRDQIKKAVETMGAHQDLKEFWGWRCQWMSLYMTLCSSIGRWELYPSVLAYQQGHHSAFQVTLPKPISTLNKGSKQDQQSITIPGLPAWSPSSLIGQHRRHLLGSNWPANTTQHTRPAQRLFLHTATFSRLEEIAILSSTYLNKYIEIQTKWEDRRISLK